MDIPLAGIRTKVFLVVFICTALFATEAIACRFWGAVSSKPIAGDVIVSQLLELPNSLKSLGEVYADGWSVAYYHEGSPVLFRGAGSSSRDPEFDRAVRQAAESEPHVVISHLRRASSGCVEGVPNPHPFTRRMNNAQWLFGHNGHINKKILINLIGEEYLQKHPPETCTYDPPGSWIDSELYFTFLLKRISEEGWDVRAGIQKAISELYAAIGDGRKALNFFLTDGTRLWAFRDGPALFYSHSLLEKYSAVASTPPAEKYNNWHQINDGEMVIMSPDTAPELISVD